MDKKLNKIATNFDGLFIIEPNDFKDKRGWFSRVFCQDELKEISIYIQQINHSFTKDKGTARGMHFQYEPNTEVKIIKCIKGAIYDVVVDIRKDSSTFLQCFSIKISAKNQKMLYIPKGFAHGFQTLKDNTELLYLHSSLHTPNNEGALNIKDPILNIKWPLDTINVSKKDKKHKFLNMNFEGLIVNEL